MPSTGTLAAKTASGARGLSPSVTLAGPPESTMPRGANSADARVGRGVEGPDLAIDAVLAQAARDELGDLAAEVEDEDAVVPGGGRGGGGVRHAALQHGSVARRKRVRALGARQRSGAAAVAVSRTSIGSQR